MTEYKQAFENFLELLVQNTPFILTALIVFIISIYIGNFLKKFLNRNMRSRWKESVFRNFISEIVKWIVIIIGLGISLNLLGVGNIAGSLVAGAGVSALIIGFAFKDIAENFLSGIILAINRPFHINDIIEVNNYKGPVRNLYLRVTHIRTADGKDIYIPNANIIKGVLINYTRDNIIRQEFIVRIPSSANVTDTRNLLLEFLQNEKDVLQNPSPQVQIEEFNETFVVCKVMFWLSLNKIPSYNNSNTGEPMKSKILNKTKELLQEKNVLQPATTILEHKMFSDNDLNVKVTSKKV